MTKSSLLLLDPAKSPVLASMVKCQWRMEAKLKEYELIGEVVVYIYNSCHELKVKNHKGACFFRVST